MSGASLAGASVLVTGARGFLGGAICRELRRRGAQALVVPIDLAQPAGWEALDACGRLDAVVHCAAVLPGALPERELLLANLSMTCNLIEWARAKRVGHFAFASSCRVYGLRATPCAEHSMLQPPDLYSVGKVSCELMLRAMLDPAGIPACSLRIPAPYGPGATADTVLRRFLTLAAQGKPLTVHGSGARSQDFVYEDDVARAFCMALAARASGSFNVAGGASVSMRELAQSVLALFGRDPQRGLRFAGADAQEHYRGSFPVDAAAQAFGYRPQVSIDAGLALTARGWGLL